MTDQKRRERGRGIVIGTVKSTATEENGHFAEIEVEPSGYPLTCRVGAPHPGVYLPLAAGTEVVVAVPVGDSGRAQTPVILSPLWSKAEKPPAQAVSDPDKIWVVTSGDVRVVCAKAMVEADEVHLGDKDLLVTDGVVCGRHVCQWGGTHTDHSQDVRAKD